MVMGHFGIAVVVYIVQGIMVHCKCGLEDWRTPAEVESNCSFNGVNDHAQDEEALDCQRIINGYVVEEKSEGSEMHVR